MIDAAKGIGIILVFIGHLLVYGSCGSSYIFSFHMPLFFVLAGVVFRVDDFRDFRSLGKNIYNGIVLPAIVFNVIGLLLFALRAESPFPSSFAYEEMRWFFPRVVGDCNIGWVSTWFLTCLAGVKTLYWHIRKIRNPYVRCGVLVALFFLGNSCGFLPSQVRFGVPCKLLSIPVATFYLGLGCELKKHILQIGTINRSKWLLLLGLATVCFLCAGLSQTGETPNIAAVTHVNPGFSLAASMAGTLGVFFLAQAVQCRVICFIGRYSLFFFLLEGHLREFILLGLRFASSGQMVIVPMETKIPIVFLVALVVSHLLLQSAIVIPLDRLLSTVKRKFSIL